LHYIQVHLLIPLSTANIRYISTTVTSTTTTTTTYISYHIILYIILCIIYSHLSKKKSDQLAFIAARSGRSTDTAITISSAVRSTILSAPALSSSTPGVALYSSISVNPVIYC